VGTSDDHDRYDEEQTNAGNDNDHDDNDADKEQADICDKKGENITSNDMVDAGAITQNKFVDAAVSELRATFGNKARRLRKRS